MQLTNCTVHIDQYIESQTVQNQYVGKQITQQQQVEHSSILPQKNDYVAVLRWLKIEKANGHDYYKEAGQNRAQMCRTLSNILGWTVDANSLRKAQNREE